MKSKLVYLQFLILLFPIAGIIALTNPKDGRNFKVIKLATLNESLSKYENQFNTAVTYQMICPNGSIGCGTGPGPNCTSNINCGPVVAYHEVACPINPTAKACQLVSTTSPTCSGPKSCPNSPTSPTKHPLPCAYGTIAYGCYSGWVSGPGCETLKNCEPLPE